MKKQWVEAISRAIRYANLVYEHLPSSLHPNALAPVLRNQSYFRSIPVRQKEDDTVSDPQAVDEEMKDADISFSEGNAPYWSEEGEPLVMSVMDVPPEEYLQSKVYKELEHFRHHPRAIFDEPVSAFNALVAASRDIDRFVMFISSCPEGARKALKESQLARKRRKEESLRQRPRNPFKLPEKNEDEVKVIVKESPLRAALVAHIRRMKGVQSRSRGSSMTGPGSEESGEAVASTSPKRQIRSLSIGSTESHETDFSTIQEGSDATPTYSMTIASVVNRAKGSADRFE